MDLKTNGDEPIILIGIMVVNRVSNGFIKEVFPQDVQTTHVTKVYEGLSSRLRLFRPLLCFIDAEGNVWQYGSFLKWVYP